MTRDDLDEYLAHFNARRYEELAKFYADDVIYVMDPNNGKIFHGPQAIIDLYKELHQYFDEELAFDNVAMSDTMIAVEVPTLLHCKKEFDLEGFVPIPEGQTCKMMCFNHYDLNEEGKFKRLRVAIHSLEYLPR